MLKTYNVVLINSYRNFKKNIVSSPILYILFSFMLVFSIFLVGFLTLFFIRNDVSIDLNDVFFVIFFLFMIKCSYDFYNYFTKSYPVTYALSTQVSHFKTAFEIFLVVFWVQLGLWVFFSTLYNVSLVLANVGLGLPILYLKFTFGIMLSSVLGCIVVLHYFSKKKYRLIPVGIILYILSIYNDIYFLLLFLAISFVYLLISLKYCLDSYQYIPRLERKAEKPQVWLDGIKKAVFYKEITTLWRERVLFSMIFSSVLIGIGSGYIARFGADKLLPESLQLIVSKISPESYAFFGIYVLTIHGAVFISLSLFLNEEQTIWILHHLPVKISTIVAGKALVLVIPLICSIPFIAYYSAFTNGDSIIFLSWFLVFSYLAAVTICFPLGAKYVGKKSDILLLYSVSLLVFIILGVIFSINSFFRIVNISQYLFYIILILAEFAMLFVSLKITEKFLSIRYKNLI